jgi:hypothetical protein
MDWVVVSGLVYKQETIGRQAACVLIKAADPAATRIRITEFTQSEVHLLNQSEGCIEKTLFTCLPVEFEKITHGKGVSPQVTLERP